MQMMIYWSRQSTVTYKYSSSFTSSNFMTKKTTKRPRPKTEKRVSRCLETHNDVNNPNKHLQHETVSLKAFWPTSFHTPAATQLHLARDQTTDTQVTVISLTTQPCLFPKFGKINNSNNNNTVTVVVVVAVAAAAAAAIIPKLLK